MAPRRRHRPLHHPGRGAGGSHGSRTALPSPVSAGSGSKGTISIRVTQDAPGGHRMV